MALLGAAYMAARMGYRLVPEAFPRGRCMLPLTPQFWGPGGSHVLLPPLHNALSCGLDPLDTRHFPGGGSLRQLHLTFPLGITLVEALCGLGMLARFSFPYKATSPIPVITH